MTHRILTRVSETDMIELCTALRVTAERYSNHASADEDAGNANSAEYWAGYADRCMRLYTQIMDADVAYIATCTGHEGPGNTFEINANETRDLPGEFQHPF